MDPADGHHEHAVPGLRIQVHDVQLGKLDLNWK